MIKILVIYHSQGGNTRRLAEAAAAGAAAVEGVSVMLKTAGEAGLADLAGCRGLLLGSPEYFGYMAGALKDFFDRTYEAGRERREVFKKPYAVFISAGNDGSGALASIERIARGYPLKKVQEAVVIQGPPDQAALERVRELGQTLAAGCEAGIF
ncbi:MAG: NAD(P)H-dependent oxidoreductase [Deltaproteobacteria bacterium]|nr:NAD(P)H-dependent oxidoreductase [Deltaproteobacteria bacterium]